MKTLFLVLHVKGRQSGTRVVRELLKSAETLGDFGVLVIGPASATPGDLEKSPRVHFTRAANAIGHGGLQKVGFRYAIENKYDLVAPLFTDIGMKYDSGRMASLLKAVREMHPIDKLGCVLGAPSFPLHPAIIGEIALNIFAPRSIRGWFSPNRIYSVAALKTIPFELAAMGHQFDTEILLQLADRGFQQVSVNIRSASIFRRLWAGGFGYLWNSWKGVVKYSLQKYSLFYDIRFQKEFGVSVLEGAGEKSYDEKWDDFSPHAVLFRNKKLVPSGSSVMDIGCSSGYVAAELARQLKCRVTGVDMLSPDKIKHSDFDYIQADLEKNPEAVSRLLENKKFDLVLLLDVLEHLSSPEKFLLTLYKSRLHYVPRMLVSTANVGFIGVRLMLLGGFFNYGAKGILDITHKRLFTFRTFRNMMDQTGFVVLKWTFFPVPFRKLGMRGPIGGLMEKLNRFLIVLSPSLFSYQMMVECVPGVIEMDYAEGSKA